MLSALVLAAGTDNVTAPTPSKKIWKELPPGKGKLIKAFPYRSREGKNKTVQVISLTLGSSAK